MNEVSPREAAQRLKIDPATVRRDIRERGFPVIRKGRRGPGNEAILDLEAYTRWRGQSECGLDPDAILAALAADLLAVLEQDHAAIRADTTPAVVAKVLLLTFQRVAERLGRRYRTEDLPSPIRKLLPIL